MQITLLGTGTSTGVPMIGCKCRTCRSTDSHDKRLRVSVLIRTESGTILIDTSSDFRQQMLTEGVDSLDAILYTHYHHDHISGFDDLRAFQFLNKRSPKCYATSDTYQNIRQTYAYAFGGAEQTGGGLPSATFTIIDRDPFEVCGVEVVPIPIFHGKLPVLGFRIGNFAYMTDCNRIPAESYPLLTGLDTLVLDALRFKPHPTHFSVTEAIAESAKIGARMTYFTHINHDILHAECEPTLPNGIHLGYDGLSFTID